MIDHILWDVDGTLFDTYPAITFALSKSLKELGLSVALNLIDGQARRSLDDCLQTLSQRHKLDPDLLRSRFAESYQAVPPENQPPFPRVGEVCTWIQERGGRNVIVTHRGVASTQRLLAAHDLAPLFAGILSVEQGYPRKPDPALFMAALQQFELDRTATLVIGDREIDIQAGRVAGLRTCLFGQEPLAELANYRIDDYGQLLALLMEVAGHSRMVG